MVQTHTIFLRHFKLSFVTCPRDEHTYFLGEIDMLGVLHLLLGPVSAGWLKRPLSWGRDLESRFKCICSEGDDPFYVTIPLNRILTKYIFLGGLILGFELRALH
jgi:hypothetical protein